MMAGQTGFTPLVVLGSQHFIGYGSDGTIHTHWDAVCFQLLTNDFYLLNRACFLFEQNNTTEQAGLSEQVGLSALEQAGFIAQTEGNRVRVWVAQVGFALPRAEFLMLRQMLHEAALLLGESVAITIRQLHSYSNRLEIN